MMFKRRYSYSKIRNASIKHHTESFNFRGSILIADPVERETSSASFNFRTLFCRVLSLSPLHCRSRPSVPHSEGRVLEAAKNPTTMRAAKKMAGI